MQCVRWRRRTAADEGLVYRVSLQTARASIRVRPGWSEPGQWSLDSSRYAAPMSWKDSSLQTSSHIASTTTTHSAQMALNRFIRSTNIVIVSSLMQLDRNLAPAGLVPLGRSTGPATLSTALTSRARRCSAHLSWRILAADRLTENASSGPPTRMCMTGSWVGLPWPSPAAYPREPMEFHAFPVLRS